MNLVKATVDQIVKEGHVVTIDAICRKSIELDLEGRGVKKSAVLENSEAHAYYRQHSASYKVAQIRKQQRTRSGKLSTPTVQPLRINLNRDVDRARYRYLQMTKLQIVERLLIVEQAYAELAEQQARLQFEWLELQQQQEMAQQKQKSTSHFQQ